MKGICFLFFLLILAPLNFFAQVEANRGRGFNPSAVFQSESIDNINLFNGNLVATIPIGQKYPLGPKFAHGLTLIYNSNLWENRYGIESGNPSGRPHTYPSKLFNAGLGWQVSLGKFFFCTQLDWRVTDSGVLNFTYVDSAGASHKFFNSLHPNDPADGSFNGNTCTASGTFYTRDGSYLRLKALAGGTWSIEFPNGEIHSFDGGGRLTEKSDRFGNEVNVKYCSSPSDASGNCALAPPTQNALEWVLTDSHNRRQVIRFQNSPFGLNSIIDWIDVPTFGGGAGRWDFVYENANTAYFCPFYSTNPSEYTLTAPFLTAVIPPTGTGNAYEIPLSAYNIVSPPPPDSFGISCNEFSGLMKSITLPTKGRIEWDYTYMNYAVIVFEPDGNCPFTSRVVAVTKRRLRNADGTLHGEWDYARTYNVNQQCAESGDGKLTLNLTDPDGNLTKHYFWFRPNSGLDGKFFGLQMDLQNPVFNSQGTLVGYLSSESFDSQGVLQRKRFFNFESEGNPLDPTNGNIRKSFERTEFVTDSSTYTDTYYSDFDGLGNFREVRTEGNFNLDVPTQTGNVRKSKTGFNPTYSYPNFTPWPVNDPWILDTYTLREVIEKDENGVEQKETAQYCFEKLNGFLGWSRRFHNDNQQGTTDTLTRFLRTDISKGFPISVEHYGGDSGGAVLQNTNASCSITGLGTPPYKINHTYQFGVISSTQYQGATFKSLDQTIDSSTGLITSSRGTDGALSTIYEYDGLGRLKWIKPTQDAWTKITYVNADNAGTPARVDVQSITNGNPVGAVVFSESRYVYDGFGRQFRTRRRIPGFAGFTTNDVVLNALGQISVSKEEYSGTEVPGRTNFEYDAFGRATRIIPPEGSLHDISIAYRGLREIRKFVKIGMSRNALTGNIDETSAKTTETFDQHGRLWKVTEPNGTETQYFYDVGSRLKKVVMTSGGVSQIRKFTYDDRGFLLSETHPEKTTPVTYSNFDCLGKPRRKTDGSSDLEFIFDSAERLIQVKERATGLLQKEFLYATNNTGINYKKGKLITAVRYNQNTENGAAFNVNVQDVYKYEATEGRLSNHTTNVSLNGATMVFGPTSWKYNQIGQVEELGYPQPSGQTVAEKIFQSFTNGLLTSIHVGPPTNQALLSLTYHSNGMMNRLTHENGVVDVHERDPYGKKRPYRIRTENALSNWDSGIYSYDGAGNIVKMGNSWFTYDSLSRITEARLKMGNLGSGIERYQQFTYDAFGNIQNVVGSVSRATPTNSNTNRLTGFNTNYDSAGNMTVFNGYVYQYDQFHQLKKMNVPGEEWIYAYNSNNERILAYKVGSDLNKWTIRDMDGKVLKEFTQNRQTNVWTTDKKYVYAGNRLMFSESGGASLNRIHYHPDHLGTPRLITQGKQTVQTVPLGTMLAYHVYFPFGEEASNPNQDFERMKFTGHERDFNTPATTMDDLDYMRARYYSPVSGRFMRNDPVLGDPQKPQSWNRYSYVLNNPLKFTDPSGLTPTDLEPTEGPPIELMLTDDTITVTAEMPMKTDDTITVTAPDPGANFDSSSYVILDIVTHGRAGETMDTFYDIFGHPAMQAFGAYGFCGGVNSMRSENKTACGIVEQTKNNDAEFAAYYLIYDLGHTFAPGGRGKYNPAAQYTPGLPKSMLGKTPEDLIPMGDIRREPVRTPERGVWRPWSVPQNMPPP